MELIDLIRAVMACKSGNKCFALFGLGDATWRACIGNSGGAWQDGKVHAEYETVASTPEDALQKLLELVAIGIPTKLFQHDSVAAG